MLEHALSYIARGWHIFPVRGKTPLTARGFQNATNDEAQVRRWWTTWPDAGIGLATGEASGVVVVDVDGEAGAESLAKLEPLPDTLESRTGTGGRHLLFRWPGQPWGNSQSTLASGIDTRGDGGYIVLPPSLHPNGNAYQWASDLPMADLPAWWVDARAAKPAPVQPASSRPIAAYDADHVVQRARAYLARMEPAVQGAGGHTALLKAASALVWGFDLPASTALDLLWGEFNPRCVPPWDYSSAKERRDFERKVKEADKGDGLHHRGHLRDDGLASDDDVARGAAIAANLLQASSGPAPEDVAHGASIAASLLHARARAVGAQVVQPVQQPVEHPSVLELCTGEAFGGLKLMADWITRTAIRPQPEIAMAATIAFWGALLGQKVRMGRARTNVYTIAVAKTGAGKNRPHECIDELSRAIGLEHLLEAEPASDAGLIAAMADHPAKLFLMDEWGDKLASATRSNAGAHQANILAAFMEMFSSAAGTFRTKAYADRKERPKVVIDQPCCCLFGTTTPSALFAALRPSDIETGFANRLLFFFPSTARPQARQTAQEGPPDDLVDRIQRWAAMPIRRAGNGNLSQVMGAADPVEATVTPAAQAMFKAYASQAEAMVMRHDGHDEAAASLWVRVAEHANKLALVAAGAATTPPDNPQDVQVVIDDRAALWGIRMAHSLIDALVVQVHGNVAGNDAERGVKELLARITATGSAGISRSKLAKTTKHMAGERNRWLAELLESGEVVSVAGEKPVRGPTPIVYVASCHTAKEA